MGQGNFKKNSEIKVTYQSAGVATGLTVIMEIYDETGAKDGTNFPDVTMTEIGTTGRYIGSFIPDEEGEWTVTISDSNGGEVVRQYSVGSHNVSDVGNAVESLNDISVAQVNAVVGTALADYNAATEDDINGLKNPPMIG